MGEKQWRQKTANTRKTPKIHEKGSKMVKIINVEILAIVYFSRMEFKSRKSRTIVAREIYPVYSIDRFMAFFVYFCFFSGIFCFQIIRFDPRNYCFEIFYEILIFLPYFFEGGGMRGRDGIWQFAPGAVFFSSMLCLFFSFYFPLPSPIFLFFYISYIFIIGLS